MLNMYPQDNKKENDNLLYYNPSSIALLVLLKLSSCIRFQHYSRIDLEDHLAGRRFLLPSRRAAMSELGNMLINTLQLCTGYFEVK